MISNHAASETKLFMARKTKSRRTLRSEFRLQAVRERNHVNRLKAELQNKSRPASHGTAMFSLRRLIKSAQAVKDFHSASFPWRWMVILNRRQSARR